jgi:hypothetical protein
MKPSLKFALVNWHRKHKITIIKNMNRPFLTVLTTLQKNIPFEDLTLFCKKNVHTFSIPIGIRDCMHYK